MSSSYGGYGADILVISLIQAATITLTSISNIWISQKFFHC